MDNEENGMLFWLLGSCYDVNVLQRSPLFSKLANGKSAPVYDLMGHPVLPQRARDHVTRFLHA
jgi:hypothetical protein